MVVSLLLLMLLMLFSQCSLTLGKPHLHLRETPRKRHREKQIKIERGEEKTEEPEGGRGWKCHQRERERNLEGNETWIKRSTERDNLRPETDH